MGFGRHGAGSDRDDRGRLRDRQSGRRRTRRITDARLYLHSYVDLYGTASHVVTGVNPSVTADGEVVNDRGALAVHVRMLEVLAPAVERMKEHI